MPARPHTADPSSETIRQDDSKHSNVSLHLEIFKLGKRLKHLQPPGGFTNGLFQPFDPAYAPPLKVKSKDYTKSHIFSPDEVNPRKPLPLRCTTKYKLFGAPDETLTTSKRRLDRMKSSVFQPDSPPPALRPFTKKGNPITGEACKTLELDCKRLPSRRIRNPITFEGVKEIRVYGQRPNPPGGKASIKLEYHE